MTLEAVAMKVGTDSGNLSRVERGAQGYTEELLFKIASALGVAVSDIFAVVEQRTEATGGPNNKGGLLRRVPVVGNTQGGPDVHWQELGYPTGWGDEYLEIASPDPNAYVLRVRGSSMSPRMHEGEAVLVEPGTEPQPGDEVVVKLTDDQVMVKTLVAARTTEIVLGNIADTTRFTVEINKIAFMHFVAGVFNPRAIKKRLDH